jgi:kumamolisin
MTLRWSPGQQWVMITGAPGRIDRSLGVTVNSYRGVDGRVFFSENHPAATPADVCDEVAGVGVIRSFQRPRNYDVPGSGLLPQQLLNAYDATPLASQGVKGQGQTVVFFETDGFSTKDLQSFSSLLPPGSQSAPNVQVVGGNPKLTAGQGSESTMDIETVHEIAPAAKLVYINLTSSQFNATSDAGVFLNAFQLANKNWKGAIWSMSLGLCESDPTLWNSSDLTMMDDAIGTDETTNNTTVFAASGDSGGLDCAPDNAGGQVPESSWQGVSAPASLPSVTGVGGTSLSTTANGGYVGETTWSEPLLSQGTGGGVSSTFPQPSWQTGTGTGGQYDPNRMRQVPDVAADADLNTGTVVVNNGQPVGGGTSLATPMWAGFTALIDQYLTSHGGHPVGFFNPLLYSLANGRPSYPPLHDITVGGNDFYPAGTGYDMTTGLGSPNVWNLARDLAAGGD